MEIYSCFFSFLRPIFFICLQKENHFFLLFEYTVIISILNTDMMRLKLVLLVVLQVFEYSTVQYLLQFTVVVIDYYQHFLVLKNSFTYLLLLL